ncbi:MAG: hypothetical protein MUD16_01555 [Desulfobacterales bacterium]|jgi:hypothetical protein|nr:hypothetical protein [Desulfobacterales bacterium]
MDIHAIIDLPQPTLETAGLSAGDLLRVRVAALEQNGRALIDIGRFRVSADIRFPTAAGDTLLVRVADAGNRLNLQLVQRCPPAESPATSAAAGPARVDLQTLLDLRQQVQQLLAGAGRSGSADFLAAAPRQALEALGNCLAPIDPESEPGALSRAIARRCEEGGLFLEARLAHAASRDSGGNPSAHLAAAPILASDLKARLLFLKAYADSAEGAQLLTQHREFSALMRAAGRLLAEIRSAQEHLARQAQTAEPFHMFHMALPLPEGRAAAALKIAWRSRRRSGAVEGHRASLLLTIERIGPVRADLLLLQRSLTVGVYVSDASARDWVEQHVGELRGALAPFFENVGVQVSVSQARIERFAAEEYRAAGEGQVDVRI